jgi:two-component system, sensor histidine kinase LadS
LRRLFSSLLCLWTLCCLAPSAIGQELGRVFDDSPMLALAAPLQWQSMAKGAVKNPNEFNEPSKNQGFAILRPDDALPTGPGREVWLRFALPATTEPQTWFLRIPRLQVERVTLFFKESQGPWLMLAAGEQIAPSQWPVKSRTPSFELHTHSTQERLYFIKLEHRSAITERPELISPAEYIDNASRVGTLIGLVIGLFGLLMVLGLATTWLYRNVHYVWFALLVVLALFTQLVLIGYGGLRLWPHSAYLSAVMGWITPLVTLAVAIVFTVQVSYAKDNYKTLYRVSLGFIALLGATTLAFALMNSAFPRVLLNALAAGALLWLIGSNAWIAWRSQPWLWYVVAGFSPVGLSMLARLAYNVGWIPHVELVQLISVVTSCMGMMLIYVAMVLRSRETYVALERENALNQTDASTGLSLARIVQLRLPQVIARSRRFDQPCSVMMLRWIDYQKHIGPLSAAQRDVVLSHLGSRLRRLARDIDTVGRWDDDHFVYIIESPVSRELLNGLSSKIMTTCLRPARQLADGDVYNVHLTIWESGRNKMSSTEVMEALRTRLNQMRDGTQRRVQFVDSPLSTKPGDSSAISKADREDIVAKINAIEADPIVPKLAPMPARLPNQNI